MSAPPPAAAPPAAPGTHPVCPPQRPLRPDSGARSQGAGKRGVGAPIAILRGFSCLRGGRLGTALGLTLAVLAPLLLPILTLLFLLSRSPQPLLLLGQPLPSCPQRTHVRPPPHSSCSRGVSGLRAPEGCSGPPCAAAASGIASYPPPLAGVRGSPLSVPLAKFAPSFTRPNAEAPAPQRPALRGWAGDGAGEGRGAGAHRTGCAAARRPPSSAWSPCCRRIPGSRTRPAARRGRSRRPSPCAEPQRARVSGRMAAAGAGRAGRGMRRTSSPPPCRIARR